MKYYNKISELIGNTPLLRIPSIRKDFLILLKIEKFNPGGSIKDRSSLGLIKKAEEKGKLKKGMTLVESSSGNTAIAFAMLAKERGYNFMAIVDGHAPKEKIEKIKALDGKIHFVDTSNLPKGTVGVDLRRKIAKEIALKNKDFICLDQYDNNDNRNFYYKTLGKEILDQTDGKVNYLIGSVGTGSSLCGTGKKLKDYNNNIKIIATEPEGSILFGKKGNLYFQSGPGFPENAKIPKNINYPVIDENIQIKDKEAFNTCRFFAKNFGLLFGDSSGGNLFATLKLIQRTKETTKKKILVTLISDGGESYLSHAYNDSWMQKNKLLSPKITKNLSEFFKNTKGKL